MNSKILFLIALVLGAIGCNTIKPPSPPKVAAQELGTVVSESDILGRAGGHSVSWQGRMLWLFGRTALSAPGLNGLPWLNSSAGWLERSADESTQWRLAEVASGFNFVPLTVEESRYNRAHFTSEIPPGQRSCYLLTPGPAWTSEDGSRLCFLYRRELFGKEPEPEDRTGTGVMFWNDRAHQLKRGPILFDREDIHLGESALRQGNMLYLYGCQQEKGKWVVRVGRVRIHQFLDRDYWQFWNGTDWIFEATEAKPAISDAGPELSVLWCAALGHYVAFYLKGTTIECRVAVEPQGPWSPPVQVGQCLEGTAPPHSLVAHSELEADGGRTQYLTYVRPAANGASELCLLQIRFLP